MILTELLTQRIDSCGGDVRASNDLSLGAVLLDWSKSQVTRRYKKKEVCELLAFRPLWYKMRLRCYTPASSPLLDFGTVTLPDTLRLILILPPRPFVLKKSDDPLAFADLLCPRPNILFQTLSTTKNIFEFAPRDTLELQY